VGRVQLFAFIPLNLDDLITVNEHVGHELDWLRRRLKFVPPTPSGFEPFHRIVWICHGFLYVNAVQEVVS